MLAFTSSAEATPWSTIRFRRAKDKKGWALLGIPRLLYPLVASRLFDLRAQLLSRHDDGSFTSLLLEAPPQLTARLACAFPAPPGCEALKVSASGDRILTGKAARSPKAVSQQLDPGDAAALEAQLFAAVAQTAGELQAQQVAN